MAAENTQNETEIKQNQKDELPLPWKQIQGAFWLIGLAILFWKGWWWPGILVLVAVSGLFQGIVQLYLSHQKEQNEKTERDLLLAGQRGKWLPATCPKCGGPISVTTVNWTGPETGDCPYCHANLKP
jgi:hypothetical protein